MKKRKLDEAFFYEHFSRLGEMMDRLLENDSPPLTSEKYEGTLDDLLSEYMPDIGKQIFEEEEKQISMQQMPKDMEDRLMVFIEKEMKKECLRKKILHNTKIASFFLVGILGISATILGVKATFDLKAYNEEIGYFGVELISNENERFIGKEKVYESNELSILDKDIPYEDYFKESNIAESMDHDIFHPYSVSDIKTKNGFSPELIFSPLSSAILYQDDYKGWYCKEGDILCYDFTKYRMDNGRKQDLTIGYVYEGVMYFDENENYNEINGRYQLQIKKEGNYYIFLFNTDTDYLSFKEGIVSIKKGDFK